ncbi:unnamed protein product [Acanthoscelides obtectus]|uniref:Uncharacterized protein n=1 Tax=Acanthoscelides obtectus TaxID=200917 RepID=A0A9P0LAG5_ACAOB|nr:unnamed protein product [Acanthoscelides obtectus]CAK1631010.1 hypothetical protein AOBTE_LOCUS6702 [Acanthoscelides obtectus]
MHRLFQKERENFIRLLGEDHLVIDVALIYSVDRSSIYRLRRIYHRKTPYLHGGGNQKKTGRKTFIAGSKAKEDPFIQNLK